MLFSVHDFLKRYTPGRQPPTPISREKAPPHAVFTSPRFGFAKRQKPSPPSGKYGMRMHGGPLVLDYTCLLYTSDAADE